MKMKLPLLCRNTRSATETAVKLTRLSKVELFCARNWGKPQIKHLVREARVELSRKAVSVDGANWVYDTIPQGSLPPFPLAEVERYFNTGMIVINAQNQTGVEPDVKMYPRLRFCCKAVGYYVMSYQFLPAPIEETIGLYFYNRIEELNLDSDPEADSSVTEDWAMEVNPAFKLPGEELTLHKADGSLSRMGLVWAPDGIDHIAMLIKVYNKEGQSLLLLERPEGSMFFNQERLAWAYNQSVIVTDDPQAFLVNRCDKDFVMLGCFGDVRENTAECAKLQENGLKSL